MAGAHGAGGHDLVLQPGLGVGDGEADQVAQGGRLKRGVLKVLKEGVVQGVGGVVVGEQSQADRVALRVILLNGPGGDGLVDEEMHAVEAGVFDELRE
ncbi:hypothetical protein DL240_18675 [Lujinxingia litoralis]|uniref:Uncharacterized protein n=1 Tax=Lujinxingia litoralis TaxID=2211119 RepID=A0A328C2I7_9DELT|nr:hypothetical protein DL240_18675 [Lujinxingia litoralis]